MMIPTDIPLSLQVALRELDARLERLTKGSLEMRGRRVSGAGDAIREDDLVTLGQVRQEIGFRSVAAVPLRNDEKWERIGLSGLDKEWLRPFVSDNRVLIGGTNVNTVSAYGMLTVTSASSVHNLMLEYFSDDAGGVSIQGFKGRGSRSSPAAVQNNDFVCRLSGGGYESASVAGIGGDIAIVASENWSSTAHGTALVFSVTKNGGTTNNIAFRILNTGVVLLGEDLFGGNAAIGNATEELTLSTVGATTDTAANLLPVGALILAVNTRITTALTGPTTSISVGDATTANRFANNIAITANATNVGIRHQDTSLNGATVGPAQVAAAPVRITANGGTPTAGKVRISVSYVQFTPPTS